jgi:hypothetical protein
MLEWIFTHEFLRPIIIGLLDSGFRQNDDGGVAITSNSKIMMHYNNE